jgi:hypothetical protein
MCWDSEVAPLNASVPVVTTEVGTDWTPPYSDAVALDLMQWADERQLGYLAWAWNTWGGGDALLTNYSGESTTSPSTSIRCRSCRYSAPAPGPACGGSSGCSLGQCTYAPPGPAEPVARDRRGKAMGALPVSKLVSPEQVVGGDGHDWCVTDLTSG